MTYRQDIKQALIDSGAYRARMSKETIIVDKGYYITKELLMYLLKKWDITHHHESTGGFWLLFDVNNEKPRSEVAIRTTVRNRTISGHYSYIPKWYDIKENLIDYLLKRLKH